MWKFRRRIALIAETTGAKIADRSAQHFLAFNVGHSPWTRLKARIETFYRAIKLGKCGLQSESAALHRESGVYQPTVKKRQICVPTWIFFVQGLPLRPPPSGVICNCVTPLTNADLMNARDRPFFGKINRAMWTSHKESKIIINFQIINFYKPARRRVAVGRKMPTMTEGRLSLWNYFFFRKEKLAKSNNLKVNWKNLKFLCKGKTDDSWRLVIKTFWFSWNREFCENVNVFRRKNLFHLKF